MPVVQLALFPDRSHLAIGNVNYCFYYSYHDSGVMRGAQATRPLPPAAGAGCKFLQRTLDTCLIIRHRAEVLWFLTLMLR